MRMTETRKVRASEIEDFIDCSMSEIDSIYLYAESLYSEKKSKRTTPYLDGSKAQIQAFSESLEQSIASYAKYSFSRDIKCKCGYFYIISNPVFPNMYKLGFSLDCVDRLNQYQTYCPNRDFVLEKYVAVTNARQVERLIIDFLGNRMKNEWFYSADLNNDWKDITKHIAISTRENNRFYYKPI